MRVGVRLILSLLAMTLLVTCSHSSTSYSAICARCLQHQRGVEKQLLGITYFCRTRETQEIGGLMSPAIFSPNITPLDPHLFEQIFGHRCEHVFMRGGFCRSSWGMVACGRSGAAAQYRPRNILIEATYRAYLRTQDQALARETYALIDELLPIQTEAQRFATRTYNFLEMQAPSTEPPNILFRGLGLASNAEEWRKVLDAARNGNGAIDLFQRIDLLLERLQHNDLAIRFQAIDQLIALNTSEAWEAVANTLKDPSLREHATEKIVLARHFPLFDEAIRHYEVESRQEMEVNRLGSFPSCMNYLIEALSDQEIRTLFDQQKARTNLLAMAAVRYQQKFAFLEQILTILNQQPSRAAVVTIESLIAGPQPFPKSGHPEDANPWQNMKATVHMGPLDRATLTASGKQTYRLMQKGVALGLKQDPANWQNLNELYNDWFNARGNEWVATGFAQAMAESNHSKTIEFLCNELNSRGDNATRTAAALSALGIIADSGCLPALERFREDTKGGHFDQNAHFRRFRDYALHRCQGIHKWQLVKGEDGTYSIAKPK